MSKRVCFKNLYHLPSLSRPSGLTMIEILIVISIIAILSALIVPKLMKRPDQARVLAAKQDISTLTQALNFYKLDNFSYPTTDQGLISLVKKPTIDPIPPNWMGPYINKINRDPWGGNYHYKLEIKNGFEVLSYGADKTLGGIGINEDISSKGL